MDEHILYAVYKNPGCTVAEIHEADAVLAEMTMQRLSAAVRVLSMGTDLDREDVNGTGHFTLGRKDLGEKLMQRYMPKGMDRYTEAEEYINAPVPETPDISSIFKA